MGFKQWIDLFGLESEDRKVKTALSQHGVTTVPPIEKDDLETKVQLKDRMLTFTTASLYPSRASGGDGTSLLTGLVLPLKGYKWGEYKDELPFGLDRGDSQQKLRSRFGAPLESNETFRWDEWTIDGLKVRVTYAKDLNSLNAVSVHLPEEV